MGSKGINDVAVIGAAGFVGRELLRRLEALDLKVTAVVRGLPELSVEGNFHDVCSDPAELAGRAFDVVLNLAYPSGGKRHEHPMLNEAIMETVGKLVRDGGKVIQVSSLAVFGGAVDRPVALGPVAAVRDTTYVESKIAAEHGFIKQQAEHGLMLDIVRLGNVWGYASAAWALPIVQRLLTGRPVGVSGTAGFSNTTDVANVADYLAFTIRSSDHADGVRYHHLAEFSGVRWGEWVGPLAELLNVEPTYVDASALPRPASSRTEVVDVLAPMRPRSVYRQLADGRVTGSWTRTMVRGLPSSMRTRMQSSGAVMAADPEVDPGDRELLSVLAGRQEFKCAVSPDWTPPLSREQSLDSVIRWLERG
jgi:nucleoside-diphosphate-sugar epimerase